MIMKLSRDLISKIEDKKVENQKAQYKLRDAS